MLIRLCPNKDGTFSASMWDYTKEEYIQITVAEAMNHLANEGTMVEVAVNDPSDENSHYECEAMKMCRI